jgi:uncharacterized protein (TIGR03086 family)
VDPMQADFARAVEQFGEKVHAITDDQWSNTTPCTEWNVHDLVNHLVYESLWAPALMGGETVAQVGDRYDGDTLGADPASSWDAAAAKAVAAFQRDGAMEVTIDSSMGPLAARTYLSQLFLDVVIHGWDLARGIGTDDTIDPAFADQLYAEVGPREDEIKSYGLYGDRIIPPDDADMQTKLLAVLGRVQPR